MSAEMKHASSPPGEENQREGRRGGGKGERQRGKEMGRQGKREDRLVTGD